MYYNINKKTNKKIKNSYMLIDFSYFYSKDLRGSRYESKVLKEFQISATLSYINKESKGYLLESYLYNVYPLHIKLKFIKELNNEENSIFNIIKNSNILIDFEIKSLKDYKNKIKDPKIKSLLRLIKIDELNLYSLKNGININIKNKIAFLYSKKLRVDCEIDNFFKKIKSEKIKITTNYFL